MRGGSILGSAVPGGLPGQGLTQMVAPPGLTGPESQTVLLPLITTICRAPVCVCLEEKGVRGGLNGVGRTGGAELGGDAQKTIPN